MARDAAPLAAEPAARWMKACLEALHLSIDAQPLLSRRFCLHHTPAQGPIAGCVLHVHAFAEEMNKSRRMAALQARELASAGYAVLQMDLFGCGDSDGAFVDATWQRWCEDIDAARDWLLQRHRDGTAATPFWLWGHRAGALLAVAAAARWEQACNFLFWQPVPSGRAALQQFLRLRSMGDLAGRSSAVTTEQLRSELGAGRAVDVAGYRLAPDIAFHLEQARLVPPLDPRRVVWIDLSARDEPGLSPASAAAVEAWRAGGHDVAAEVVRGPAFWQTAEIEVVPALLAATVQACLATVPTTALDA
jgi:uncharacterized protein